MVTYNALFEHGVSLDNFISLIIVKEYYNRKRLDLKLTAVKKRHYHLHRQSLLPAYEINS
jgi:hypothetical protein